MTLKRFWQRLRGMIGTAIVWAGAYAVVGLGIGAWFWVKGESIFGFGGAAWLTAWAEGMAIAGAISGGAFSLAVMVLQRRGDFTAITPLRFGFFGAIPAAIVMGIIAAPQTVLFGLIGGVMGFICGSGSVVIARRALLSPPSVKSLP